MKQKFPFINSETRLKISRTVQVCSVLLVLIICGCKDKTADPQISSSELTAHTWLQKDLTAVVDGKTYTNNESSSIEITFNSDGVYKGFDTDDSSTEKGTWKLVNNTLTITGADGTVLSGEVSQLTEKGFILSLPQADLSNLDLSLDLSDIKPGDQKYNTLLTAAFLFDTDFPGLNTSKIPNKVQLKFGFQAK